MTVNAMTLARAALVGFGTVLLMEIAFCFVLLLVAHTSGWSNLHVAVGTVEFFTIHTAAKEMNLSTGNGLVAVAVAAGVANAAGAYWLRRAEKQK